MTILSTKARSLAAALAATLLPVSAYAALHAVPSPGPVWGDVIPAPGQVPLAEVPTLVPAAAGRISGGRLEAACRTATADDVAAGLCGTVRMPDRGSTG